MATISTNGHRRTENHKPSTLGNREIAKIFEQVAELLDAQHANPYRVRAYRVAAETLRATERLASDILAKEGLAGLERLPGIGVSLARSIAQILDDGRLNLLERLRGETRPERVLATVPGIGSKLAERIHEQLDIESLADLENAAYDGRLDRVPGFGAQRLRGVRESLAGRLHRHPRPATKQRWPAPLNQPSVAELLDIDREYLQKVNARELPLIAPRRFNPTREAWLPVLHTERGEAHYTALFSNTARAHELDMIHDWVVIYRDDQDGDGQWTVVTSQYGSLRGKRIVRGREPECEELYKAASAKEGNSRQTEST